MTTTHSKPHWAVSLWPGLFPLWTRGSWAGLALATGFAGLLNLVVACTLVWPEWLSPGVRLAGAWTAGAVWILAYLEARADGRRWRQEWALAGEGASLAELQRRWFREAQRAYLRGDGPAVHALLDRLLRVDPRDAEAQLLRATLLRHEGQRSVAERELQRLELWESAAPWRWEIAAERRALADADAEAALPSQADDAPAPPVAGESPAASLPLPRTAGAAADGRGAEAADLVADVAEESPAAASRHDFPPILSLPPASREGRAADRGLRAA